MAAATYNIEIDQGSDYNITIEVNNILGKSIFRQEVKDFSGNFHENIDLEEFSQGVYIVNIISDTGKAYAKRLSYIK